MAGSSLLACCVRAHQYDLSSTFVSTSNLEQLRSFSCQRCGLRVDVNAVTWFLNPTPLLTDANLAENPFFGMIDNRSWFTASVRLKQHRVL